MVTAYSVYVDLEFSDGYFGFDEFKDENDGYENQYFIDEICPELNYDSVAELKDALVKNLIKKYSPENVESITFDFFYLENGEVCGEYQNKIASSILKYKWLSFLV